MEGVLERHRSDLHDRHQQLQMRLLEILALQINHTANLLADQQRRQQQPFAASLVRLRDLRDQSAALLGHARHQGPIDGRRPLRTRRVAQRRRHPGIHHAFLMEQDRPAAGGDRLENELEQVPLKRAPGR